MTSKDPLVPLRIVHVAESFAAGVFEVVRTLSRYQSRAGHEVTVAFARRADTPADLDAALGPGVEHIELPWKRRAPLSTARASVAIRAIGRRLAPDIAHLHSSFAGLAGSIALPRQAATVYTPHGYSIVRQGSGALARRAELAGERWIAGRVNAVGAVSEQEAELARGVVGAHRVAVIPNGIPELDPGKAPDAPAGRSQGRPLVVTMGRITPQRQPEKTAALLRGVRDLADIRWIGDRIGEDDATPVPDVPITGWLGRDEALAELGAATAYVNWSAWEGSPLAVLEAMARDVVVVASDIPAHRELLGPEHLASDAEEAIALLREILSGSEVRERMLTTQRANRARFSAERMAADWETLYRELSQGERLRT